ncbi:cytosolic endo-beta-N-acetylglucosaminidase 1 isoform X1 [Cucumis melo var. makuwa]|uniref:Cytosolic endo-beta-N-acetylglucosaminidase 1 isoform X1 n=1 Tax=Cucumis melo var. makuwa TaxID=1194695 RepID=A0A5A7T3D4_CUCMM|nr:cytosolic endo-beta-N-acetylglucosaminidase 1 isoform X1 [Cucumis melo var. makuwa]TYK19063.1 cytosolic endo-beta-N-acetylglucosaminidase 1 isoform X1 [Cucumis melo var. makuwa]
MVLGTFILEGGGEAVRDTLLSSKDSAELFAERFDGWYDSVTVDSHLHWQNELNEKNEVFFDILDGIFVNYGWREGTPQQSAAVAGGRKHGLYMGIDVLGRGTFGGGGWNTNVALDVLKRDDVSAAIFAPGWVHEHEQETDFQTAQNNQLEHLSIVEGIYH